MTPEIILDVAQYGSTGIAILLIVLMWLHTKNASKERIAEKEIIFKEREMFNTTLNNHLQHLNDTLQGMTKQLEHSNANHTQMITTIERNTSVLNRLETNILNKK